VRDELRRSGFDELVAAGIVLTGGSAKMEGVIELAEEIFHAPVRLGLPQGVSGLVDVVHNPIHSTGVGLLWFGRQNYQQTGRSMPISGGVRSVIERMKACCTSPCTVPRPTSPARVSPIAGGR